MLRWVRRLPFQDEELRAEPCHPQEEEEEESGAGPSPIRDEEVQDGGAAVEEDGAGDDEEEGGDEEEGAERLGGQGLQDVAPDGVAEGGRHAAGWAGDARAQVHAAGGEAELLVGAEPARVWLEVEGD